MWTITTIRDGAEEQCQLSGYPGPLIGKRRQHGDSILIHVSARGHSVSTRRWPGIPVPAAMRQGISHVLTQSDSPRVGCSEATSSVVPPRRFALKGVCFELGDRVSCEHLGLCGHSRYIMRSLEISTRTPEWKEKTGV